MNLLAHWLFVLVVSTPGLQAPVPVVGERAVVVSAHPLATEAGLTVLGRGGNLVDAAVAVSLALSVVEPFASGIGGGGFAVVHLAGRTTTFDAREMAPGAATRDMFVKDGKVIPGASTGTARAAGIPGLVRGLRAIHRGRGKLAFADLVAPAIGLAREGFRVTPQLHDAIGQVGPRMNPAARRIFLDPEGKPPAVWSVLRQPDLATTLEAIAQTEGEDLYTGAAGRELVRALAEEGGLWTAEDLAGYRVVERPPVRGTYRGLGVASMGPPSSGGLLLVQMLGVLERLGPPPADRYRATEIHRWAETMKRGFALRAMGLGDPDFAGIDSDRFLGAASLDALAASVRAAKLATPAAALSDLTVLPRERTHTSHFAILTAEGDAIAMTQTINLRFGNGMVAGKTGVVVNNQMDDFSALPGAPNAFGLVGAQANAIQPQKRPLSSMTPTLVLDGSRAVGAFGSPGGSHIITATLQVLVNVVDHGMDVGRALAAPRIHHQWYPDLLMGEAGAFTVDAKAALEALGHQLQEIDPRTNAMALWRLPNGHLSGAADPRGEGEARAW
jgi:gamma-glutamyltranspeptidase/glutathione hydrolase